MNNISDEIINKAKQGDQVSFEAIYREYSGFVYNVAWRIVNRRDEAEEVAQEVFIAIYKKLDSFDFRSSLKTWMYRITINTALNYLKRMSKAEGRHTEYQEQVHHVPVVSDIEKAVNKEENENLVSKLLDVLNADQRACVVLRSIEGLSYEEIADVLKININTVRSRLSRARESMLKLKKEGCLNEM